MIDRYCSCQQPASIETPVCVVSCSVNEREAELTRQMKQFKEEAGMYLIRLDQLKVHAESEMNLCAKLPAGT